MNFILYFVEENNWAKMFLELSIYKTVHFPLYVFMCWTRTLFTFEIQKVSRHVHPNDQIIASNSKNSAV
jgi:hypothetical protein